MLRFDKVAAPWEVAESAVEVVHEVVEITIDTGVGQRVRGRSAQERDERTRSQKSVTLAAAKRKCHPVGDKY